MGDEGHGNLGPHAWKRVEMDSRDSYSPTCTQLLHPFPQPPRTVPEGQGPVLLPMGNAIVVEGQTPARECNCVVRCLSNLKNIRLRSVS